MHYSARIRNCSQFLMSCSGLCLEHRVATIVSKRYAHSLDSYQYMQQSEVPTMHFQPSLPRLPIPQLDKTCDRFLSAAAPILDDHEFESTKKVVHEFYQTIGAELNVLLQQNDVENRHTSYISKPWFDMYLSDRQPLPLNYNPLLVMKEETRSKYSTQLHRATNLIINSLRFWRSLRAGLLEPEVFHMNPKKSNTATFRKCTRLTPKIIATYMAYAFKAFPLDMSQYERLFGLSRIPDTDKDRLTQCIDARHVLVMRQGNMYAVDVLNEQGNIEAPQVVLARLNHVIELDKKLGPSEAPLGVLTACDRNEWALMRRHLANGICEANKHLLENEVDAALFCVCLDSNDEPIYSEENPVPLLKNLLAGVGKNRWFDKSISLLLSADGTAAVNFEHSWGDGVAVLRYFNEIYKESIEKPFVSVEDQPTNSVGALSEGSVRSLQFQTDEKMQDFIIKAIASNTKTDKSLNINILRYPHINKPLCKNQGVSPDAIMQLSFQLAYRKSFHGYVGTYESCSTAAFRHGRTETIRPCTKNTKEFCEYFMKHKRGYRNNELISMIRKCAQQHGQLAKEAAMGQGFDRHLFALKHIAMQYGKNLPLLYSTKAYAKLNYNILSTSTLSSDALLAGAFGPVVKDGLGIGYSIQNSECGAVITSYNNQRDGKLFAEILEESLNDIYGILSSTKV